MSSAASQTSRIVHWPTSSGGNNWQSALTNFARLPNPSKTTLPPGVYLRSNSYTLTIFDGYPKSKFHFLTLPRMPFWLEESTKVTTSTTTDETTTQQNQDQEINGKSPPSSSPPNSHTLSLTKGGKLSFGNQLKGSIVPNSHLSNLTSLIHSPHASFVLNKLREESENVIKLIKEEMIQTPFPNSKSSTKTNVEWGIRVGFHAVPSMSTVHLHVISDDLVSECLKNKKHYQSFHPTHGFWLDLDYVENLVNEGKKYLPQSDYHYEKLLKHPLVSFRDGQMYGNIPKLKAHLEQAWIDDINQRRKVKSSTSTVAGNKHELDESEHPKGKSKVIKT